MTPQDHNRVIGIMHLIWGGFNALTMLFVVPFLLMLLGFIGSDPQTPPEAKAVFGAITAFIAVIALVFTLPPLLAGYALLKRKSWARVAGIVAACFTAFSMPFGTALTVYTLWFLCGPQGERFYRGGPRGDEGWRASLRDASTFDWEARRAADARPRRDEYVPPPQPPDWRG